MSLFSPSLPKRAKGVLVLTTTLLMAGCFQQQQTLTLHEDGRAELAAIITFPGEMKEVEAALRARAAVSPRLAGLNLDDGLCEALNQVPAAAFDARVQAREIVSPESYTCRLDIVFEDFPAAIESAGAIAAIAGLSSSGERTYRFEAQLLPLALGKFLWRGIVQRQYQDRGLEIAPEELNVIVERDQAGAVALATMLFRDATSTFTVRAAEIVESNGVVSEDRTSVTFKTKISDVLGAVLKPESIEVPVIVFRY